jgi:hypothetical protein
MDMRPHHAVTGGPQPIAGLQYLAKELGEIGKPSEVRKTASSRRVSNFSGLAVVASMFSPLL